jgi:hypothetical protein
MGNGDRDDEAKRSENIVPEIEDEEEPEKDISVSAVASPRVLSPCASDPKMLLRVNTLQAIIHSPTHISGTKKKTVRDRIRDMHAIQLAAYPKNECEREATVLYHPSSPYEKLQSILCCHKKPTTLYLDQTGLLWQHHTIPIDDILGAQVDPEMPMHFLVVHAPKKTERAIFGTARVRLFYCEHSV